jgi:hypothetical protein
VDGSAAGSAQNVNLLVDSTDFGIIQGLAPGDITFKATDVSVVTLNGSSHANTWNVQDTFKNPSFKLTRIVTDRGGDTVNVLGTTGTLEVDGLGGNPDTVNVGGDFTGLRTLNRILGDVQVFNFGGADTILNVNGGGDRSGHFITLSATSFQGEVAESGVTGKIHYDPAAVSVLNVFGGHGDQFFVLSTAGAAFIQLLGGSGDNQFTVGSPFNSLDTIHNTVFAEGGVLGFNTLFIRDNGAALGHSYDTSSPFQIVRSGGGTPPVTVQFLRMQSVQLFENGQSGAQAQDLALTERVRVGQPARLTGTLVDADPSQVLSLTVDWGDGSDPQTSTPDRDPFEVTHSYASPGRYFVHVTWSDSDGRSNSRDLLIRARPARGAGASDPGAAGGPDAFAGLDAAFALLAADKDRRGEG